jgi:uncharacterized protein (TIGR02246 family)
MDAVEAELRGMYDGLLAAWAKNSAEDYASHFTADAQYIIAAGAIENGRDEIVAGHREIFATWAKGSTLTGQVLSIRQVTPDVRLVTATGGLVMAGAGQKADETTIYTLLALRTAEGWRFAAYQNTPVVSYG